MNALLMDFAKTEHVIVITGFSDLTVLEDLLKMDRFCLTEQSSVMTDGQVLSAKINNVKIAKANVLMDSATVIQGLQESIVTLKLVIGIVISMVSVKMVHAYVIGDGLEPFVKKGML